MFGTRKLFISLRCIQSLLHVPALTVLIAVFSSESLAQAFDVDSYQTTAETFTATGQEGIVREGGTIDVVGDAISDAGALDNLMISNFGTIDATQYAINIGGQNGYILNEGSIIGGWHGVFVSQGFTVENNGLITTTGIGIEAFPHDIYVINRGVISAGDYAVATSNDGLIVNYGTMSGTSEGIHVEDRSTILNYGTIAGVVAGITMDDQSRIINYGSISSDDYAVIGDEDAYVENHGTIEVDQFAIYSGSVSDVRIINTGVISADSNLAVDVARANISNSGTIRGTQGLRISNSGTVDNSGKIVGSGGSAIEFTGATHDNTLILHPGHNVQGTIDFGGGTDTLDVKSGQSVAYTFVSAPEVVVANGNPVIASGNQVVVSEVTAHTQSDDTLDTLNSSIFNVVHSQLKKTIQTAAPVIAFSSFSSDSSLTYADSYAFSEEHQTPVSNQDVGGYWVRALGGYGRTESEGSNLGAKQRHYGSVVGADADLFQTLRVGGFAGYIKNRLDVNNDSQSIDTESFFGGGYISGYSDGGFARFLFNAGINRNDSHRNVANNLAAGGAEVASATYMGSFVSSEILAGTSLSLGVVTVEPSVRVLYAHQWLEAFSEAGSVGQMSFDARGESVWLGGAQLAFPYVKGTTTVVPRVGVEARKSNQGNISAELLGQVVSINSGSEGIEMAGLVGLNASTLMAGNFNVSFDSEAQFVDRGFTRGNVSLELRARF